MDRWRTYANLATLANGLVGLGAILYTLAGNKLWAMLLIVCGLGFDGLDGIFARRGPVQLGPFGRLADSLADAISFGLAPALLIAVHTDHASQWQAWTTAAWLTGSLFAAFAIARLTYFTIRGYQRPYFLGAPTPQSALAIVVLVLFGDLPAFWGTDPPLVLIGAALVAVVMILPLSFPKIRRGARLRAAMAVTGGALVVALVPLQLRPAVDSPLYLLALGASLVSAVGVASYYLWGPQTVVRPPSEVTPA